VLCLRSPLAASRPGSGSAFLAVTSTVRIVYFMRCDEAGQPCAAGRESGPRSAEFQDRDCGGREFRPHALYGRGRSQGGCLTAVGPIFFRQCHG